MTPPQWRDESKALRAKVLESTGKTVEEGGLELLLKTPGAAEDLHSLLGCDAQVLAAELARTEPACSRCPLARPGGVRQRSAPRGVAWLRHVGSEMPAAEKEALSRAPPPRSPLWRGRWTGSHRMSTQR